VLPVPEIIGLLRSLKAELKTIFLFSNKVVEVPFPTLLAGQVQTTYGTDFDCIAEHVLANPYDKAVIRTDGYASMTEGKRGLYQAELGGGLSSETNAALPRAETGLSPLSRKPACSGR